MDKNKLILKKLVCKYKNKLGLSDYIIDSMLCDNDHIVSNMAGETECMKTNYDACVLNKDFGGKEFYIVFNKDSIGKDLPDTVCHELLHILLWGFADVVENLIHISGLSEEGKAKFIKELTKREHDIIERIIKALL